MGNNNKTTFIARIGCQSVVLFLVLIPYIYILNFSIFPWLESPLTTSRGVFHSMLSTLFTILILVSYYLCKSTNPGEYQDTLLPSYYLNQPVSQEDDRRFCTKCDEQKPERAHHCNICKKCVLRMEHHSMWIGNCIGLYNLKYYILFLFYSSVSIIYFLFLLVLRATQILSDNHSNNNLNNNNNYSLDITNVFISGLLVIVMVATEVSIGATLCTQVLRLGRNITSIEQEDIRKRSAKKLSNQSLMSLIRRYDKGGVYNNIASVFGSQCIGWLLPIQSNGDIFFLRPSSSSSNGSGLDGIHSNVCLKKGDIFVV
ncbi:hypothetical protein SAMD00019534_017910, partial [Acytostelium subglobosum LB1]|uniref:hypothetical protein n=1 Tax=Acytostelium subglobosum LB1 TaxID=1410327 RepID=UPI000645042C